MPSWWDAQVLGPAIVIYAAFARSPEKFEPGI